MDYQNLLKLLLLGFLKLLSTHPIHMVDMRWNGKRIVSWCHKNPNIAKDLKEIVTGENYLWDWCESITVTLLQNQNSFFIFFVYIFIRISANMSLFGLKFSQMILHTETSKLMNNWYFLFVVLHKPTLLPSTFKVSHYRYKRMTSVHTTEWFIVPLCSFTHTPNVLYF